MQTESFRDWLRRLRMRRDVCMLIPMEARMGFPVEVRCREEYLLPFYHVDSETDVAAEAFAYLSVHYPDGEILAYSKIFPNSPECGDVNPLTKEPKKEPPQDYLDYLTQRINGTVTAEESPDVLLSAWIDAYRPQLRTSYRILWNEKKRRNTEKENHFYENC